MKHSFATHVIVFLLLCTSFVGLLIMAAQFFKGLDSFERTWDSLAQWVDDVLED